MTQSFYFSSRYQKTNQQPKNYKPNRPVKIYTNKLTNSQKMKKKLIKRPKNKLHLWVLWRLSQDWNLNPKHLQKLGLENWRHPTAGAVKPSKENFHLWVLWRLSQDWNLNPKQFQNLQNWRNLNMESAQRPKNILHLWVGISTADKSTFFKLSKN